MFYMSLKYLLCGIAFVACATIVEAFDNVPESISASISLKVPGNGAKHYPLTFRNRRIIMALIIWRIRKDAVDCVSKYSYW